MCKKFFSVMEKNPPCFLFLKFQAVYADDIRKLLLISSRYCLASGEIPVGVVGSGQLK